MFSLLHNKKSKKWHFYFNIVSFKYVIFLVQFTKVFRISINLRKCTKYSLIKQYRHYKLLEFRHSGRSRTKWKFSLIRKFCIWHNTLLIIDPSNKSQTIFCLVFICTVKTLYIIFFFKFNWKTWVYFL